MTTDESCFVDVDASLLARVVQGDEQALAELYDRHGRAAYALACRVTGERETAEEVVQEAFLAVWRRAETYRPDRGSVRGWLLTVVRHRAIDLVRARATRPRTTLMDDLRLSAPDDPLAEALASALAATVRTAVAALPPEQRIAVELAYFAGLSYPAIAARVGAPLGTVKSRLRLALERLRRQLTCEYAALSA